MKRNVVLLSALLAAPVGASSMIGVGWSEMHFKTVEGQSVDLVAVGKSGLNVVVASAKCRAEQTIDLGGEASLPSGVGFYSDLVGTSDMYYVLKIPAIRVEEDKDIHYTARLKIRDCKVVEIKFLGLKP